MMADTDLAWADWSQSVIAALCGTRDDCPYDYDIVEICRPGGPTLFVNPRLVPSDLTVTPLLWRRVP